MKTKNPVICFVTPYSLREITGVGKFVEELHDSLKKRNIDSFVITKLVRPKVDTYVRMVEINCDIIPHFRDIYLAIITAIEIFKHRKNITLLHLQTPLPQSALAGVTGKILGIPVVTTIHGVFPESHNKIKNFVYRLMSKMTFLLSSETIFVSRMSKRYYNILFGKVILNGINTDKFILNSLLRTTVRENLLLEDDFVFLFVGRITSTKGIDEIIKAVSLIKNYDNKIKILMVGPFNGKEEQHFKNKIKNANIGKYIINVGAQKKVHQYYCASDVLLLPSYFEGLPLVILEAMSSGMPVIASRVGEIPFIINHYQNGLLIEPQNVEDLLEKMIWCLNNKEKLSLISENAAKTIKENFSLEKMTDEYLLIYNTLAKI